jgi:hypothetical protein
MVPGVETLSFVDDLSAGRGHKPSATIDCLESIARWCQQIQAGSLCYFTPLHRCCGFGEKASGCPCEIAQRVKHNEPYAFQHALLNSVDQGVTDLLVGNMPPPEEHVGSSRSCSPRPSSGIVSLGFDTAGERLDEIAAGKSEGDHGR